MGRISTINQKKKEKREQFAAGRVINLTMDLTPSSPPAAAMVDSPGPIVAQPAGTMVAEMMPGPDAQ